jgi:hypothetical protein
MTKTTDNQQLVLMLRDYGVSHVFFVPTIRMASFVLMEGAVAPPARIPL